jgi:hypothetical protein
MARRTPAYIRFGRLTSLLFALSSCMPVRLRDWLMRP